MNESTHNPADYARRLLASQPRLRAYVRSMVFNAGDVDDLLQDVATIGWERFADYDRDRPFDSWLLGVARNRVLQYFEAQKKRPNALSTETLQQLEAVAFNASQQADDLQDAEADPLLLCIALSERENLWISARRVLSEEVYAAMWLRYVEDMSINDVAAVMDRTVSWTKVNLLRARKQLDAELTRTEKESKAYG